MNASMDNDTQIMASKYCLKCQYVLDGLDRNRCPECGWEFDPADGKSFLSYKIERKVKRAVLWLMLAGLGFATSGDVLWAYLNHNSLDNRQQELLLGWIIFWILLAIFAVINSMRHLGNNLLNKLWFMHDKAKIIWLFFSYFWIMMGIYCVALGPTYAAFVGKHADNGYIAIYPHIRAIDDADTISGELAYQYMKLCSDPIARIMLKRALDYEEQGEYEQAMEAISNFVNNPAADHFRARFYLKMGDLQSALAKCNITVKYNKYYPSSLLLRARIYRAMEEWELAIEDNKTAINNFPNHYTAHNSYAWALATCPDETIRDGELAVEHAKKACALTNWEKSYCVDTLAAAYAEVGNFALAIETLEKAIEMDPEYEVETRREMMGCFIEGKAYREEIKKDE